MRHTDAPLRAMCLTYPVVMNLTIRITWGLSVSANYKAREI